MYFCTVNVNSKAVIVHTKYRSLAAGFKGHCPTLWHCSFVLGREVRTPKEVH